MNLWSKEIRDSSLRKIFQTVTQLLMCTLIAVVFNFKQMLAVIQKAVHRSIEAPNMYSEQCLVR